MSPAATNLPLSLRDISPRGDNPSVKPYGLPAPLSGEPLLIFASFIKKFLFIASLERGGGPSETVEGVKICQRQLTPQFLIPHSSFLIIIRVLIFFAKYSIIIIDIYDRKQNIIKK